MKFTTSTLILLFGATLSLGWNIAGQVITEQGEGIPDVQISSFNYTGIAAVSDASGNFQLSNDPNSIQAISRKEMRVHFDGKFATLQNVNVRVLKISLLDALGKVTFQQEFFNANGSLYLDLSRLSHSKNFLKISADGAGSVYALDHRGILKKAGDPLASLFFKKDGFEETMYQMKAEEEVGVKITLKVKGSSKPISSSSQSSSSSAEISSSSEIPDEPVNCATKTLKPGDYTKEVDGRKYIVHVPNTYTGSNAVPLLVDYHPIMGSAQGWASSKTYEAATLSDAVIIAYPDGATGGMGQAWNVGPCCTDADDITFSRHLIQELQNEACIDPKRIYAAGFSMGGGMSNYVACKMADVFAATAPASFDLAKEVVDAGECKPSRPISVLNFRGSQDGVVPYAGGYSSMVPGKPITFLGAQNNLKEWAKMNSCSGEPKDQGNGCVIYENCSAGVQVGLCTDKGGASCSGNGHDAGCAEIGWKFLKQFTKP
ncbi:MAG: feruloyl esterase [Hallerella sp.]|uniref:Poly(3-hydroxybutyrate) depolymerase n=1 Tax=Hallerella porci TaxID=1945871 RepID=A0ABX5LLC9_9BACT|nr:MULTISPECIES: PHB depolymerase family esterase [Hallerella]MCI5600123.1 feruloyl esterase [Hallerella sp.]PWL03250.1 poly(3-hydroxybutyrate) depolymerase [Hallerella porci]